MSWINIKSIKTLLFSPVLFISLVFVFTTSWAVDEAKKPTPVNSSLETLKSLPYFNWAPAKNTVHKKSVVTYDKERACPGINIYNSRHLSRAHLMDMNGKILHSWFYRSIEWNHIELCRNGDLIVIVKEKSLMRIDWNSQLLWRIILECHHDLDIDENGDIYVIASKNETFYEGLGKVKNDYIVILTSSGEIKKEISLYDILKDEITYNLEERLRKRKLKKSWDALDLFHTNSIEIIPRNVGSLFKKGHLLLSARDLNLVFVIDMATHEIIWKYGSDILIRQHHPTLLENNNILIFDNRRKSIGSRVVEINPLSKKIVWQFPVREGDNLCSELRGANQRLPNGNTLITESDQGHVLEITKEGEIVWDFYNPDIKNNERGIIYRMMRILHPESFSHVKELEYTGMSSP